MDALLEVERVALYRYIPLCDAVAERVPTFSRGRHTLFIFWLGYVIEVTNNNSQRAQLKNRNDFSGYPPECQR